ncbi:MAG: signal transduction histidine kinase/CheY-like chemotaxis protein, partial [Flavobacterium sp.]
KWYGNIIFPTDDGIGIFFSDITERKKAEYELITANKELAFQNEEKEKRAAELIIMNELLTLLNKEKEKRASELVIAKEKAEESDRLKSAFIANMSHEIRTPMNGILGFSALLNEPGLGGDQQQQYIDIIQKSGARMLNLVSEIMDVSKIEVGLMEANYKGVNINEMIEYIHTLLESEAKSKNLILTYNNSLPVSEAVIHTDEEKLFAILTNLVKNAIKYTDTGSIDFGYNIKGDNIEFFVKDSGIGIPKNRREAVFERFVQADIADIQARQGVGLGLFIAKSYVELLGGKIWIEEQEAIGSLFIFTLPYNRLPEVKNSSENSIPENTEINPFNAVVLNLKTLIVEDDKISQLLLKKLVKDFSREILIAESGGVAVDLCLANPDIDLILMDIQMPFMNGYEATRQIREFNEGVVIIAQSALSLIGDREKIIEAGCTDFVSKPVAKNTLIETINKYFQPI